MILPRLTRLAPLSLLLGIAATQAAEQASSVTLVRAMRSDEIAVAGAKRAFLTGALDERYGKTQASCVRKVPYTEFTAGSARVIESVLTAQEITTALAFFESDAGTKYVEGLLRRLRASQGEDTVLPKIAGKEDIKPEQMAAIADFSRSELGRKLMGKEMTESPAALAFGRDIMSAIAAKCGGR
jgi:hypothetical protein